MLFDVLFGLTNIYCQYIKSKIDFKIYVNKSSVINSHDFSLERLTSLLSMVNFIEILEVNHHYSLLLNMNNDQKQYTEDKYPVLFDFINDFPSLGDKIQECKQALLASFKPYLKTQYFRKASIKSHFCVYLTSMITFKLKEF